MKKKLIFVYNANTGFWNKALDAAHKIVNPATYPCSLCGLTYGRFSEDKVWKDFRENTEDDFVFLYKDQFETVYGNRYKDGVEFPSIFIEMDKDLCLFIDSKRLDGISKIEDLIKIIADKLV